MYSVINQLSVITSITSITTISMASQAISIDSIFNTFDDFKTRVRSWSIEARFEYKVLKSNKHWNKIACKYGESDGCPFHINASMGIDDQVVKITKIDALHTCLGLAAGESSSACNARWLTLKVPTIITVNSKTDPQSIIDAVRLHFHQKITYKAANRVKNTLCEDTIKSQQESFSQLPAYRDYLVNNFPGTYCQLLYEEHGNHQFKRIFVCPSPSRQSFQFCRQLVALDGTFIKSSFIQTLLLAVSIDANNEIVLLAWAVVESENDSSWTYFLYHLKTAIPNINTVNCTVISDRDKGLSTATDQTIPNAHRAHCCKHLADNVQTAYGMAAKKIFWEIARADTVEKMEGMYIYLLFLFSKA